MKKIILILFILCASVTAKADSVFNNISINSIFFVSASSSSVDYCADDNIIACWDFNGANYSGGVAYDLTANDEDLTETSGTITQVSTNYGDGVDFDIAQTAYLGIGDGTDLDISGADQQISMCAIVIPAADQGADQRIIAKYPGSNQMQYLFWIQNDVGGDYFRFLVSSDGASTGRTISDGHTAEVSYGTEYHVCAVYDDIDIRVYVDGALDNTPTAHTAGIYNGTEGFRMGANGDNTAYFDGVMDEVAVWDRALTAGEVLDIYQNGLR